MQKQTRRQILKSTAVAAAAVAGGSTLASPVVETQAKSSPVWVKKAVRRPPVAPAAGSAPAAPADPAKPPMFNGIITFGNLVFIAGIGAHFQGTIEEHTKHVLDEIEKALVLAGSSMEKVLKVNVYLASLADYDRMNSVYLGRFGSVPPVRTTIAAAGVPGNSLVEIDCIASL